PSALGNYPPSHCNTAKLSENVLRRRRFVSKPRVAQRTLGRSGHLPFALPFPAPSPTMTELLPGPIEELSMRSVRIPLAGVLLCIFAVAARAEGPAGGDFKPDPKSVERYGLAYRYPQAGWVVLHIEGEPYERGYQHGRLMAPEIAGNIRCFATVLSSK